jgi:hypothetical protein
MNRCVSIVLCSGVFVVCADVGYKVRFRNVGSEFRSYDTEILHTVDTLHLRHIKLSYRPTDAN